jgi:hypothetical protein
MSDLDQPPSIPAKTRVFAAGNNSDQLSSTPAKPHVPTADNHSDRRAAALFYSLCCERVILVERNRWGFSSPMINAFIHRADVDVSAVDISPLVNSTEINQFFTSVGSKRKNEEELRLFDLSQTQRSASNLQLSVICSQATK